MSTWVEAYGARTDLTSHGDNGLALFALAMKFGVEDLEAVAADAITDGSDDKKCDLVYINQEEEYAVLAQCYFSSKAKACAPANKASDLNTAIGWLLQRPVEDVPERLRSPAQALRDGIADRSIKTLYVWFVHNLPESKNVENEMVTVDQTLSTAIGKCFPGIKLDLICHEVGTNKLTEWYEDSLTPILVNDQLYFGNKGGYEISGPGWLAYSTTISARELNRLFKRYKTKMFSANVRDYLGSRSSDSNINNGIIKTVESNPENFWVFNNGLTILTHDYQIEDEGVISVRGMSIVNGAQTTGAIGSLRRLPSASAVVQARFVKTTDGNSDLIQKIIQFNNSQNKVEASDFRSTDNIQKRLKEEMAKIPDAEYEGGRRGGAGNAIRRRPNLLPSYTVGQALAAFHGEPIIAYNQKSSIWVNDRLYSKFFNEATKAAHIVCAYALIRAIEDKKQLLVKKGSLTSSEEQQLSYFRKRGSITLMAAAMVGCIEIFLGRQVPNRWRISFGLSSPADSAVIWTSLLDVCIPFCTQLNPALEGGLKNSKTVEQVIVNFSSLVEATSAVNQSIYSDFKKLVVAPY